MVCSLVGSTDINSNSILSLSSVAWNYIWLKMFLLFFSFLFYRIWVSLLNPFRQQDSAHTIVSNSFYVERWSHCLFQGLKEIPILSPSRQTQVDFFQLCPNDRGLSRWVQNLWIWDPAVQNTHSTLSPVHWVPPVKS